MHCITRRSTGLTLFVLVVMLLGIALSSSPSFARGFRGGSRSFGGGSRFSMPSRSGSSLFSKSFSWGGRNRASGLRTSGRRGATAAGRTSPFSFGSSARSRLSKADSALFEKARSRGTVFRNRSEALKAFKQQNGGKYTTRFASKPASRPSYIPRYYTGPNGSRYSVEYRPKLGGYGYYNPSLGRWMLYSVMGDALMTQALMRNSGYYYGPHPASYRGGWGILSSLGTLVFFGFVGVAAWRLLTIRRSC